MTITSRVQKQFFAAATPVSEELIRLPPTVVTRYANNELSAAAKSKRASRPRRRTNLWTIEEHERFLYGLEQFLLGPWKEIAAIVGTKTTRQTMTHAQKYRQKIERHQQRSGARAPACDGSTDVSDSESSVTLEAAVVLAPKLDASVAYADANDGSPVAMGSPLDVAMNFFDPTLFDYELSTLIADLEREPKASSCAVEMHYSF